MRNCTVVNAWSDKLSMYDVRREDIPRHEGPCNMSISVEGVIEGLVPVEDVVPGQGDAGSTDARALDLTGHFVFPGLIDSHVHGMPGATGDLFRLFHLLHGVTTVRELAGPPANVGGKPEAAAWAAGKRAGPRPFYVGQALDGPRVALLASEAVKSVDKAKAAVRSRAAAGAFGVKVYNNMPQHLLDAVVDEAANCGIAVVGHCPRASTLPSSRLADVQHLTGVPDLPSTAWGDDAPSFHSWLAAWDNCTEERLNAVAEQACRDRQAHTPTLALYFHAAHEAQVPFDPKAFLEVQCSCSDAKEDDPKLVLKGAGVPAHCCAQRVARAFLPRFLETTVWNPKRLPLPYYRCMCQEVRDAFPQALPKMLHAVSVLHRAGVILHAGTDCITPWVLPGRALHEEMLLLRSAGLSDEEVLAAATSLPGCFLSTLPCHRSTGSAAEGRPARIHPADSRFAWLGFVREGARADLVVSKVDPRRDLASALNSITAVIVDGRVYEIDDLRNRVRAYQEWCRTTWANTIVPWLAPPLRRLLTAVS